MLFRSTYNETRQLLTERREEVERLAQALLRYETLSREEVDKIMQGKPLHKQTVTDILKTEKEKTIAPTRAEDDGLAPGGVLPSPA